MLPDFDIKISSRLFFWYQNSLQLFMHVNYFDIHIMIQADIKDSSFYSTSFHTINREEKRRVVMASRTEERGWQKFLFRYLNTWQKLPSSITQVFKRSGQTRALLHFTKVVVVVLSNFLHFVIFVPFPEFLSSSLNSSTLQDSLAPRAPRTVGWKLQK